VTDSEASLLACLLNAGQRVVSRDELTRALWGVTMSDTGRAVDTHIHRLRKKLSQLSGVGIATIRSRGFRLEMSGSAAPQARWRQS